MCGANQKQHCKQVGATKTLISAEAKKLHYQQSLNDLIMHIFTSMIWFVTWPSFVTKVF